MGDANLSFNWSLKDVYWLGTLRINCLRAIAAGLVWAIFAWGLGATWAWVLAIVAVLPVAHICVGLPVSFAAHALAEWGVPLAAATEVVVAFIMLPGDPLLYLMTRANTKRTRIGGLRVFQVSPVLLLTRTESGSNECEALALTRD